MKQTNKLRTAAAMVLGSLILTHSVYAVPGDTLFGEEFDTPGALPATWTDQADRLVGFDGTGQEAVITNVDGIGVLACQVGSGDAQLRTVGAISVDVNIAEKAVFRIRKSDGAGGWEAAGTLGTDIFIPTGLGNLTGPDSQTADETTVGDGWTIMEWDLSNFFGGTITAIRLDIPNPITAAYEIDYFRIIEKDPSFLLETDPAGAIPVGFNLVQEWDTSVQLAGLGSNNIAESDAIGAPVGFLVQPCSNNAAEDCAFGFTTATDSQFLTPGGLAIPVPADKQMIVEIGLIADGDFGVTPTEIFFSDALPGPDGGFSGKRKPNIPAFPEDNALHVIRLTFLEGTIQTQLNQLRYDPATAADLDVEIDYIRIYTNTPLPTELFWDSDTVTAADQGGTGDWNTSNSFWYDGVSSNVSWPTTATGDDNANFSGSAGTVTIDAGGITASSLTFDVDAYTIDGGTLTLDSSITDGSFDVDGGGVTATVEALVDGTDDNVRKTGTGTLTLDNAANVFNSFTGAGGGVTIPTGATLTTTGTNPNENGYGFKLTGSTTLNIDGTIDVQDGSFGGFSGDGGWTVNVNTGADLTLSNAYAGWNASVTYNFIGGTTTASGFLRHQDGGTGNINVSGGTHTFGGELGAINNGNDGHTIFTISGGTFSANNTQFSPGTAGGGPVTNDYTINLDGGTFETNRISIRRGAAGAAGDNTINVLFNGGVLRALSGGASNTLIDGNTGNALGIVTYNATVDAGGAIIDTNGEDKSVDQPLVHEPALGATLDGGLTKLGTGTLLLTQANTYTGDTNVNVGCLSLDNITAIPDLTLVNVAAGAGFGGIVGASNLLDADIADIVANTNWDGGGGSFLVIDTNGADVVVAADIVGNIGLIKKGAGDLTLTGANTYSGTTVIEEGTIGGAGLGIEITSIAKTGPTEATLNFTASGNVDVYRSTDLQPWGAAIATDQASPFVDTTAPATEGYYILIPTGETLPLP